MPIPCVDAPLKHTRRPSYYRSLINSCDDSVSALSARIGVSRQYLSMISSGKRTPSYAIQYCLEFAAEHALGHSCAGLSLDSVSYFKRDTEWVAGLLEKAVVRSGSVSALALRLDLERQYLADVKAGRRGYRYPLQFCLEAIIASQ